MKTTFKKLFILAAILLLMCCAVLTINTLRPVQTSQAGPWIIPKGYTASDTVSYAGKTWKAKHAIAPMTDVAPTVSDAWAEVQ